jgi:ABC-type branched-subunit amino acid transport system substrate-binding protein
MKRTAACLLAAAGFFSSAAPAETGVTPDTILLGQSVALSGPAAALGIEMRNGAKLYFDYVN